MSVWKKHLLKQPQSRQITCGQFEPGSCKETDLELLQPLFDTEGGQGLLTLFCVSASSIAALCLAISFIFPRTLCRREKTHYTYTVIYSNSARGTTRGQLVFHCKLCHK